MSEPILRMTSSELDALASAIRAGRMSVPVSALALQRFLRAEIAESVAKALQAFSDEGAGPNVIAATLELLVRDRRAQRGGETIDLVTTGPEVRGVSNRDTSVVVRELFATARESVLVAGFAVYQGQRLFSALADQMIRNPRLAVRMFLDVQRPPGDTTSEPDLVRRFAHRFITTQWPTGAPRPLVYYYPPSVTAEPGRRACLHAKCVVVDTESAFISSANFTEAAQERNIEVGVLVRSSTISDQLVRHFDALVAEGLMTPLRLG